MNAKTESKRPKHKARTWVLSSQLPIEPSASRSRRRVSPVEGESECIAKSR
jgi:hypothetical protein